MDESITRGRNLSTYNCRGGIHKTTNEGIHNKRTNPHKIKIFVDESTKQQMDEFIWNL